MDLIVSFDYQILFLKQNFGAKKMRLVPWTSLKDLHSETVMLSLHSPHLQISLSWSKIFLSPMIKRLQEPIHKMDQLKQLFLFKVYLQRFKLMISSQLQKVKLSSLGNAILKHIIVGLSSWRNSGQELMLIMKEQLQDGSMKLQRFWQDYLQRIIFNLNITQIKLGLSLSNILMMAIFWDVGLSEMVTIPNLIQTE